MIASAPTESAAGEELAQFMTTSVERLRAELAKAIIGQKSVVEDVLLALFCGEHALLTGVPGLAKTLLVRSLAESVHLSFNRIQFTPDLMPTDITGTDIIQEDLSSGRREKLFLKGPVFCNLLLADEINRTPPRTQAAMLQTMQERQVTVGGVTYELQRPFHVFATQNPIEQEGTYPLPEAAADRFMLSIEIGYPTVEEEMQVVTETTGVRQAALNPVISGEELLRIQKGVRAMPVSQDVVNYAVRLVAATRSGTPNCPKSMEDLLRWGAGPRASQYLILAAKGRAAMLGRPCADFDGVRSVARQVLGHRILPSFKARTQGITSADLVTRLLESVGEKA
ncbi:MoxR family ATPase [Luteolibacter flavescens]|uniref:MoxR family ATPase n=1 Tax=Luteolibacter flavescens TaxID=1859460 RepID=A0ABT3FSN3_9BACT|nr:MoxR family ATPase [Luteolibacter flavescens]MCW1886319.1 MoxR family ATPase [Luteolibacter flavescens]